MTVASLVVTPKVEAAEGAAEEAPTVTVKGATLKLEGNADGTQSMRIAVEVTNADVASACGMDITYAGKTTTIATDNEGQNKIYDVDTENKKVVYTAVIKNIPDTAFASDFTINGLVKKTAATEYTKTAATKKSVNGIVDELKTKDSSIELVNGVLVKKVATLEDNQTIAELDNAGKFNYWKGGQRNGDASIEFTDGAYNVTADTTCGKGIGYHYAARGDGKALFVADVKAEADKQMCICSYWGTRTDTKTMTGDWMQVAFTVNVGNYAANYFTVGKGEQYSIKNIAIYDILTQDNFSDMKLPKDMVLNPEDIAKLSFKDDWSAGVTFTNNVVKFKKGTLDAGEIKGDSKVTFTLPKKFDLSQYKVNLTYKLDENCSKYFIVTSNCTPEKGDKYGNLTKANQSVTYENIFDGFTGNLETISFQAHPGSTENNPTMTLEKIEFLAK